MTCSHGLRWRIAWLGGQETLQIVQADPEYKYKMDAISQVLSGVKLNGASVLQR